MKPDHTNAPATTSAPAIQAEPVLWRGLDELAASPEYQAAVLDEFPAGASEFVDEPSRRRFLTIMGASLALATGAGCNLRPASQRQIYPYTTQPDEITPGLPLYFATAMPFAGYGQGVLVRSNEGRPTKVEGNPDHPSSLGGATVHGLASVLDLYDPDRSRGPSRRGITVGYEECLAELRKKLYAGGAPKADLNLRVVTETVTSPTLARLITQLLGDFKAGKWVQYEAVSAENARAGLEKVFGKPDGKPVRAIYDFIKA
ncbi:MAG: TAT-variant-translocated molybdopterin oxidoreductase, partial [Gemmataceae bacterium]|nr:TAT-variant-translocated molybdopterin oxidoreductase [Gemmataceae bacterium]